MKKITTPTNRVAKINVTDQDWKEIMAGGVFEFALGEDIEGTLTGADSLMRDEMTRRVGDWSLTMDKKNGVLRLRVSPPA